MCYRCRGEACQPRGGATDPAAAQEGGPLTPSPHRVPAPPGEASGMKWLTPVGGPPWLDRAAGCRLESGDYTGDHRDRGPSGKGRRGGWGEGSRTG
jgi:hypothetical protein